MTGENWINYYKTEDEVVEKFSRKVNIEKLPFPPGYDEQIYRLQSEGKLKKSLKSHKKAESKEELERLKRKKIWELAIKPVKSVPMNECSYDVYVTKFYPNHIHYDDSDALL